MPTIEYGSGSTFLDVTGKTLLEEVDAYHVPSGETARSTLFGDPFPYQLKVLRVRDDCGKETTVDHLTELILARDRDGRFDLNEPVSEDLQVRVRAGHERRWPVGALDQIHSTLTLRHGSLKEEYPEQVLSVKHIAPTDRVLEIGGNYGRNSCVIARILQDSQDLVVVESDLASAGKLVENRDANGLHFHVIPAAISERPLEQCGWSTRNAVEGAAAEQGWKTVETISYGDLKRGRDFNVLVADCEGALYFICKDCPAIFDDMRMVIVENDYPERAHKEYVDDLLRGRGFYIADTVPGGWGHFVANFYEVWKTGALPR